MISIPVKKRFPTMQLMVEAGLLIDNYLMLCMLPKDDKHTSKEKISNNAAYG